MENPNLPAPCTDMIITPISISMEIITEILLRLPVKSLARFKCVSKSFLSIINDPYFINLHIKRSLSTLSLALMNDYHLYTIPLTALDHLPHPPSPSISILPLKTQHPFADIIGSCHGVICISNYPNSLSIYNPSNGSHQTVFVDCSPKDFDETHWVDFGFGFDGSSADYKIIRVDQINGPDATSTPRKVSVFSLKNDCWRTLKVGFPCFLTHPMSHGKFLYDSLHWIAATPPPAIYDTMATFHGLHLRDNTVYEYQIVTFDLGSENFRTVALPDYGEKEKPRVKMFLEVLGGDLCVQVEFNGCVEMWVMKVYGVKESWVKLLSFPFEKERGSPLSVKPIAYSKSGGEVLLEQGRKHFWYDLGSGKMRDSGMEFPDRFSWVSGHRYSFGAVVYVEGLLTLKNSGVRAVKDKQGGSFEASKDKKNDKGPKKRDKFLSVGFKLKL